MSTDNQLPTTPAKKSVKPMVIALIVIGLAVVGYFALSSGVDNQGLSSPVNQGLTNQDNQSIRVIEEDVDNAEVTEQTNQNLNANNLPVNQTSEKVFTLVAKNFSFSLSEIRVKKGDKVKIVLQNTEGFHDWVVDVFNAKTDRISAGQVADVEFIADEAGQFEYYCSMGEHRQMGMKGNLIVE